MGDKPIERFNQDLEASRAEATKNGMPPELLEPLEKLGQAVKQIADESDAVLKARQTILRNLRG
jgi:HD superfamily phosphodiesterase